MSRSEEAEVVKEVPVNDDDEEGEEKGVLRWYHWCLVGAIDVIGPFSTDSYVPNQPQMRRDLETTNVLTGLTLQLNWLSKGVATLAIGALSDRPAIGRRGALLRTFAIYVVGALGSFLTPTKNYGIYTLILFRVIQGIGESGTTVCTAIARDALESPRDRLRVLTAITSLRLSAIAVAPTLGGLVGDAYGWRVGFCALAVVAVVLTIFTYFCLPETLKTALDLALRKRRRRPPDDYLALEEQQEEEGEEEDEGRGGEPQEEAGVKRRRADGGGFYEAVLRRLWSEADPEMGAARGSLIALTFGFSALLCYLSNVAPILEERFDVSVVTTALLMGSVACIFIVVNLVLAYLFGRCKGAAWLEPLFLLKLSLRLRLLASCSLAVSAFGPRALRENWVYLLLNCYLFSFGISLGFGSSNTLFVQPFPEVAGRAAAVILLTRTIMGTAMSQLSVDLTDAFGVAGFYASLAAISSVAQAAWLFLPPTPTPTPTPTRRCPLLTQEEDERSPSSRLSGFVAVPRDTAFPSADLPPLEELTEHIGPFHVPPESTVGDTETNSDRQSTVNLDDD
eukprot:CAMPEP_0118890918 /NCGR_PEP_ID=MMETSP1166-20130328/1159_1 /TAXON_ID=1104430 /ORGANISM="Chrysoreinhardia sp, Strain CCMP3193" /LENGTH=564 /DNA_ID=CAMNT_0006829551 /DNA_START=36 /DNA_END=1730 /DNA_ORIENTATION=+